MEKSNFKKLLATASAFAVITGAATGASATAFETNADATAQTGQATTGMTNNAEFKNADSVKYIDAGHRLTITGPTEVSFLDTNDLNTFVTIAGTVKITEIKDDSGGAGGKFIDTKINDGGTLVLGTDFSALGAVTLGDANGGDAVLQITNDGDIEGTINGKDNGQGVVIVDSTKTANFKAAIGGNKSIAELRVAGAAVLEEDAKVTKLTMSEAASRTTIANGKTLTISAADLHASSDISGAVNDGDGELIITEGSAFTIDATVGATKKLNKITVAAKADVNFTNTVDLANSAEIAGTVTFTKGVTTAGITSTANTAVISVGTAAAAGNVAGDLDLANGGKAEVIGNVGGTTTAGTNGNANKAATITVSKDANDANGNVAAVNAFTGSTVNVAGNATGAVAATGASATVNVAGNATAGVVADGAGATVTVGGNTTSVALDNKAVGNVAGNTTTITLGNAGDVLTLGKGTTSGAVDNSNGGQIYVTGDREFQAANGAGLGKVEVQGSGVGLTFSTVAQGLADTVLTTDQTDKSNNITISQNQTLGVNTKIGTSDNQFGNIIFDANNTLTLDTKEVYAAITANTDGHGTVDFKVDGTTGVRALGASGKQLAKVDFNANTTVAGGTYATTITIGANKTATLGGVVKATTFNIGANGGSTVVFQDGAAVDVAITNGAGGNGGTVKFEGAGSFVQDIAATGAKLTKVEFNGADKTVQVGANVYATDIVIAEGATVQLTADRIFETTSVDGTVLNGGTIDAQGHKHTASNMKINGQNNVFKLKVTEAADGSLSTGGNIQVADLNYTAANDKITIDLSDSVLSVKKANRDYKAISVTGATNLTADNIYVPGVGFVGFTTTVNPNDVTLTAYNNTKAKLKAVRSGSNKTADALANAADGSKAASLRDLLSTFVAAGNNAKVNEALDRIEKGSVVRGAVLDSMKSVDASLGARMIEIASIQTASGATVTGVAAGDDATRFGAWASPFYGHVNQSARNGFSGYKNEAYGLTAGLDTKVNEDLVLGVSVSAAHSNIKHKDTKSGDRTKVDTLLFSLYHTQAISDNWFLSGTMTFASNDVNNTAKRNIANGYETATAKYSVTSFDLKEMVGYNYAMGEATITPMIGAKYTRVNDASYTESAATYGLDIATKAFDKVDVIAGGRITGNAYDVSGVSLTPEAHAFIQYDLLNRTQKQTVSLSGSELDSSVNKPARMQYNLGLGVSSKYGAMEYGAGYDLQLASKRVGHQGSLKVRVNF